MTRPAPGLIPRPVATGIAVVITLVWTANYFGPALIPNFERSEVVNTAFMLVAGTVFALGKSRDRDDDPPPGPPPPPPSPPDPEPERDPDAVTVAELLARYQGDYPRSSRRHR